MAVNYVRVKRTINVGNNPGEKYMVQLLRREAIPMEQIAEQIANASSLTKGDIMSVLQNLQEQILGHVLNGASVRLDLLGTFSPRISVKAVNSAEEATSDTIEKFTVSFLPSTWMRNRLREVKYVYKQLDITGLQI